MARKTLHSKSHNSSSFRQFTIDMGRGQPYRWQANSRILEKSIIHAHKHKGVGGSHKHSEKFCKGKRDHSTISRQLGSISLPARGGTPPPEQNHKSVFEMVSGKAHKPSSGMGSFQRNACRPIFKVDHGQGGLFSKQQFVSSNFGPFSK